MISIGVVGDLLAREWGMVGVEITEHNGGMNSATWWVDAPDRRWVAKSVPAGAAGDFIGGLAVAARLQMSGTPAGAPVPTLGGAIAATITVEATGPVTDTTLAGRPLALLEYVPGEELSETDADDVRLLGTTLGHVHNVLRDARVEGTRPLHRIDLAAPYMAVRDWIRPAVAAVLDEYARLDPAGLTSGMLHTDPAPEAFRIDRSTGAVGLIDWSVASRGPLLYDVASAVMYVGGPAHGGGLLDAYLATGALGATEIERGLATMLRFRGAIQAMYFAWRTANNDLTGIDDASGNEEGLADARRMLS